MNNKPSNRISNLLWPLNFPYIPGNVLLELMPKCQPLLILVSLRLLLTQWTSYQIRNLEGCACAGNTGSVSPPSRVSDPDMHLGTCMTHVPWCMPGSVKYGFRGSRWRWKHSRHSRRMHKPQFYVSGKRPMQSSWWMRELLCKTLFISGYLCFRINLDQESIN